LGPIDVSSILNEELAKPPVPMKRSPIEAEVVAEGLEGFAIREQVSYRTDIAVVGAPFDERHSTTVRGAGGMALREIIEDQVGSSIGDSIKHLSPPYMLSFREDRSLPAVHVW
jgi:hypothetical protein